MSWNYRVIKDSKGEGDDYEEWYQIHEVYYTKSGNIKMWSADPISPCGSTLEELIDDLNMMIKDAWHKPVLERTPSGKKLREVKSD
jgi:hypothetical protein